MELDNRIIIAVVVVLLELPIEVMSPSLNCRILCHCSLNIRILSLPSSSFSHERDENRGTNGNCILEMSR